MKTIQLALFCYLILGFHYKMLAQNELLHRFISETNQSLDNGVVTDGTYIFGTKLDGGDYGKGYIYKVKIDNADFSILLSFDGANTGTGACGSLVLEHDTLYGTTYLGGSYDHGTIFKIKTDGTGYEKMFDFDGISGGVTNSLILSESFLYGAGRTIFKIKTDGSNFNNLFSFNSSAGLNPSSPLTKHGDFLYGTTLMGGINNNGVIYKIKTDGTGFNLLKDDFSYGEIGCIPEGNLVVIDSTIYGTTYQGGPSYAGYIYKINTDGTKFKIINNLGTLEGTNPNGLISYNSTLYGMTINGGSGSGIIFKVDTTGSNFETLHRFTKLDGANPLGLLSAFNNTFYGYANNGPYNYGVVFSLNPDGSEFTTIKDIEATNDGYLPHGALVMTSSKGYGFTQGGGKYNSGVLYSLNPDNRNYQVIHDFTGNDGANPIGSLILSNDTLFGMANMGGNSGQGAAFIYTLVNNEFIKLHDFDYGTGNFPSGSACILGSEIFGMTQGGGLDNSGTIFKMKKDGTGYSTVFDFAGTGVLRPCGTLAFFDSVFYGLAFSDTSSAAGMLVVFSIHPDGTEFSVLHTSDGIDAGQYGESIITDGTYLYAIAKQGGSNDFGVLFKMKTDGSEFSKLLDFSWDIGGYPQDPLVLRDSILYISTSSAGPGGFGGVLGIKIDGKDSTNLIDYSTLNSSYSQKSAYPLKIQGDNLNAISQAASFGNTEGAISIHSNSLFLVADQQVGDLSQGSIQKYDILAPKMMQAITFNSLDEKVYGDSSFELTATSNSGLTINYTSSDPAVASVNTNVVAITGAGVTTITASQPGNYEFEAAEALSHELRVNPKTLTITGEFTVMDKPFNNTYAAVVTEDNLNLSGIVDGDEVDFIYTAEFSQLGVGENITVSLANTALTGTDKDNYVLSLSNIPTTTATISEAVGVDEISENGMVVYPNPFTDRIYISNANQIAIVTLLDIAGQKVLEINGSHAQKINANHLKNGVYLMRVELKSGKIKEFKLTKIN
jgi:uncharacterized repeat protein (TIGR03803 family)